MNRLNTNRQAQIIRCLCEGNSVRATARLCDCAINTVVKLLVEFGPMCADYQNAHLKNLPCKYVECDEIWSFVGKKQKYCTVTDNVNGYGDCWTFTALCSHSKLMVSYAIGMRNSTTATAFLKDVASRLANRIQLSTDGHGMYFRAVNEAFQGEVDYGQVLKVYGLDMTNEHRYSPPACIGAEYRPIVGEPNEFMISTSYVERNNLTIRMGNRRFTRLTNGYSKKIENHVAAFDIFSIHYNWCRSNMALKVKGQPIKRTPAMYCQLTDHVWSVEEMIQKVTEFNLKTFEAEDSK